MRDFKLFCFGLLSFRPEPSGDGLADIRQSLGFVSALADAAGQLRALGNDPAGFIVFQDDFVAHSELLTI
jgi:hypothetical protein